MNANHLLYAYLTVGVLWTLYVWLSDVNALSDGKRMPIRQLIVVLMSIALWPLGVVWLLRWRRR